MNTTTTTMFDGVKTVVTSGLKAGETVITEGADRVDDGGRVNLPGQRGQFRGDGKRGEGGDRSAAEGRRGEGRGGAEHRGEHRRNRDQPAP